MSLNRIIVTTLLLSSLVVVVIGAEATSCGEPRRYASDKCSDEACSRTLLLTPATGVLDANLPSNNKTDYFGHGICVRGLPMGSPCEVDDDCYIYTLTCTNHTCTEKGNTQNVGFGYLGVAFAVVGFGSYFIPVKKVRRTGNGIIFQLLMGVAIMMTGILTALITKRYTFYPMSMVGGMCWAIGNVMSVPAVQMIGIGLGFSAWSITNMILGWASGKFGLMGVKAEPAPNLDWLSYVGIGLALVSICAFASVKPSPKGESEHSSVHDDDEDDSEAKSKTNSSSRLSKKNLESEGASLNTIIGSYGTDGEGGGGGNDGRGEGEETEQPLLLSKYSDDLAGSIVSSTKSLLKPASPSSAKRNFRGDSLPAEAAVNVTAGIQELNEANALQEASDAKIAAFRRILGFGLALVSGVFYGINFNPSQAMMDYSSEKTLDDPSSTPSVHFSPNGLDYVFSSFVGIFFSTVIIAVAFYAVHMYLPERLVRKYVPVLFSDSFMPPAREPVDPATGMYRFYFNDVEDMLIPALASGFVWSIAQIGWFVANTNLGLTMSFPLVCLGPSIVANTWGILLFKEIQGRRNFIFLGVGFLFVGLSCFCTVFSKDG